MTDLLLLPGDGIGPEVIDEVRKVAAKLTPAPGVLPMPNPAPVNDLLGANVLVVVAADLAK